MIYCHMVVGPGEADRYLGQVLDRVHLWADHLHVSVDARAGSDEWGIVSHHASSYERLSVTWEDHEGEFRTAAWKALELIGLTTDDWVVCLDADEVIVDHAIVKVAANEYPGQSVWFRFHEMWDSSSFRIDGYWKPYEAGIMFPYRPHGHFKDRALASGREPTYVGTLPRSRVVADILHYGYAREEDRQMKYDRYMRLDGGRFHDLAHLKSIIQPPQLSSWTKGGLLG